MIASQSGAPDRTPTVALDDVEQLQRWADGQRAEILRLRRVLGDAEAEVVLARSAAVGASIDDMAEVLFDTIDELLTSAHRDFGRRIERARRQASSVVASARQVARELLVEAGATAGARTIWGDTLPEGLSDEEPDLPVRGTLRAPRPARVLWDELVGRSSVDLAPASSAPGAGSGWGVAAEGPATVADPDHVYRVFWEQAERDRPFRARLRRNPGPDAS